MHFFDVSSGLVIMILSFYSLIHAYLRSDIPILGRFFSDDIEPSPSPITGNLQSLNICQWNRVTADNFVKISPTCRSINMHLVACKRRF